MVSCRVGTGQSKVATQDKFDCVIVKHPGLQRSKQLLTGCMVAVEPQPNWYLPTTKIRNL